MHKMSISRSGQHRHLLEPAIQLFLLVLRDALQASIVAGRCELGRFLKLCLHRSIGVESPDNRRIVTF